MFAAGFIFIDKEDEARTGRFQWPGGEPGGPWCGLVDRLPADAFNHQARLHSCGFQ